jgi:hypothetical protein
VADQDRADGTRRDRDAEPAQLTDDPPVAPGWVLARETEDEPLHLAIDRWPSRPMAVCPAARHQTLVPAQQGSWANREDHPRAPRQHPTQRCKEHPIRRAHLRALHLAAQNRDLVPQHQDL